MDGQIAGKLGREWANLRPTSTISTSHRRRSRGESHEENFELIEFAIKQSKQISDPLFPQGRSYLGAQVTRGQRRKIAPPGLD